VRRVLPERKWQWRRQVETADRQQIDSAVDSGEQIAECIFLAEYVLDKYPPGVEILLMPAMATPTNEPVYIDFYESPAKFIKSPAKPIESPDMPTEMLATPTKPIEIIDGKLDVDTDASLAPPRQMERKFNTLFYDNSETNPALPAATAATVGAKT
jgi:hypothetical protein